MHNWQERTKLMLGDSHKIFSKKHVLVVGLGGVGGSCLDYLVRSGIGKFTIVDSDTVDITNINRQVIAHHSTIGKAKTNLFKKKIMDINPRAQVWVIHEYIEGERIEEILDLGQFDYVVDAIDTLTPKVLLLEAAYKKKLKIVSSMGAGGKLDPSKIKISDISKTYQCPLARVVRKRLLQNGIKKGIKVVFSPERVSKDCFVATDGTGNKKSTVGTISYLPSLFGIHCASVVIRNFLQNRSSD